MSGTSLDGLDIAICDINKDDYSNSRIICAKTIPYNNNIKKRLSDCYTNDSDTLFATSAWFGKFIGTEVLKFITENNLKPLFIASHGHTIFHNPQMGYTTQIGCGATIAAETGITTISDFRSLDIALGGQGAPLVPIGDKLIFGNYDYCLNLGGIANVSFQHNKERIAFDISPANIPLNHYSALLGLEFDENGDIGRSGSCNNELLSELNNLDYYFKPSPKSLGVEWVNGYFMPVIEKYNISVEDKISTIYEHISSVISKELLGEDKNVLVTGGGAHNSYLIEKLKEHSNVRIVIPDKIIVDFKEAFIFALLGFLRINNLTNTLSSVTGAKRNSSGGAIYYPF